MGSTVEENRYIQARMRKMPEEKGQGKAHVLKKGESLWSLAKEALSGKGKLKKSEINDYMLRIAKMNNLDTVEKMNGLKVNTTIYLPDEGVDNQIQKKSVSVERKNEQIRQKRTSAEESALSAIQTVFTDNTAYVNKPLLGCNSTLYHVFTQGYKNGYYSHQNPVMSFNMGKDGKLQSVRFDDKNQSLNSIAYDYDMDQSGRICIYKNGLVRQQVGRLSKDELRQLEEQLSKMIINAKESY